MKHKHTKHIPIKVITDPKKLAWLEAKIEKLETGARRRPYRKGICFPEQGT